MAEPSGVKPWCVQWVQDQDEDGTIQKKQGWCATYRNGRPTENAFSDKTACGRFVILRVGEARRPPTCEECRKRIARRKTR